MQLFTRLGQYSEISGMANCPTFYHCYHCCTLCKLFPEPYILQSCWLVEGIVIYFRCLDWNIVHSINIFYFCRHAILCTINIHNTLPVIEKYFAIMTKCCWYIWDIKRSLSVSLLLVCLNIWFDSLSLLIYLAEIRLYLTMLSASWTGPMSYQICKAR